MSNNSNPNIGTAMILIHHAITRGLDVSKKQSIIFQQSGYPNTEIRDGYITYVRVWGRSLALTILAKIKVAFSYLKSILPDAPFDQLFSEHLEMDVILKELQTAVETLITSMDSSLSLEGISRVITRLTALWHPHIEKEQLYLYDASKTESLMTVDEQIKLIQDVSLISQKQGDPAYLVPFLLFNLPQNERAGMAKAMPPNLIQELIPIVWKPKWSTMQPFLLD
ncbi:MAG: hypothetical protein LRY35_00820 [Clostridiales bacterium]|nr:hypothetical protein [Clostridiales bacterium]